MNNDKFNEEEPEVHEEEGFLGDVEEKEKWDLEFDSFVFGKGPKDITLVPKGYDPTIVRKYVNEKITPQLLFTVGLRFQANLDEGNMSRDLQQEFKNHGISLSQNVIVSIEKRGNKWLITDKDSNQTYTVRKKNDNLSIWTPELRSAPFWRVRYLMDFYNLRGLLGKIRRYLVRQEETEEQYSRSICCATILGEVGQDEHHAFGREYFKYLVEHRLAPAEFDSLLTCYTAYTPELDARVLTGRIETYLKTLEPHVESDFQIGIEYRELDALLNNELYQAQKASAAETAILEIKERPKWLDELVKVYLEMSSYDGEEYLIPWAARKLRQAAVGEGAGEVISSLRRAEQRLVTQEMDDEDVNFIKTRIYRALQFFGEEITEVEQRHLEEYGQYQSDLISID